MSSEQIDLKLHADIMMAFPILFHTRTLSLLQLRGAKRGRFVLPPARSPLPSAFGDLWVLECVGEWWIFDRRCRLGTRYRGRSPGGGREVVTASPWWNKVLLALSHLVVTCSGAGGGPVRSGLSGSGDRVGAPDPVGSCSGVLPAVARRLGRASGSLAFCFVDAVAAVGLLEDRWLDRARASCGGSRRRRRALVHDPGSSGWSFLGSGRGQRRLELAIPGDGVFSSLRLGKAASRIGSRRLAAALDRLHARCR
ncbi:unnamed protein product [Miscanthus lutarioriparius]|uniref:Uncharacterized protein n=1 Tax=Miscanthus lutarioriparius TaxID=422564 RepID=A0A811NVZ2_9POAL|nr:unnamed protein product [Miscanthus lutarioriparius]